ncbi:hypothetical protein [Paenibacillus tepidiphilus]|uniref:hypothetical protein n=1 Tax=Paenibacillus tepidiphilus TaxID=2608683 RepID=UPI00123BF707|nr:hypothetical protein [Paenibacillus tepidiphilus]
MKRNLKMFSVLLAFLMLFVYCVPAPQANADSTLVPTEKLTQLSGEDLLNTLLNNGLVIPEALEKEKEYTENAVKTIITDIQRGVTSAERIPYNYTELAELARRVVAISAQNNKSLLASYTLVNSTVIGSWSDTYLGYNCYGYSIGNHVFKDPGYHSNQGGFSMSLPIASMADLVISDLNALGYWALKTTTKPSSLNYYEKVIAIRKGNSDYHFMKGDTSGNDWTHKPGGSNPLRWKYSSPGATIWTNEYSAYNVSNSGSLTYDSTIYYIKYWLKNGPGPQPTKIDPTI